MAGSGVLHGEGRSVEVSVGDEVTDAAVDVVGVAELAVMGIRYVGEVEAVGGVGAAHDWGAGWVSGPEA